MVWGVFAQPPPPTFVIGTLGSFDRKEITCGVFLFENVTRVIWMGAWPMVSLVSVLESQRQGGVLRGVRTQLLDN